MEFKEKENKIVETRNYELDDNGYIYKIEANKSGEDLSVEMKIFANSETITDNETVSVSKSASPTGIISLKDNIMRVFIEGDTDKHIAVFNEFMKQYEEN